MVRVWKITTAEGAMGGNGWVLSEACGRSFQLQKASKEGRGCLTEQ